jgi:hypothetical protein
MFPVSRQKRWKQDVFIAAHMDVFTAILTGDRKWQCVDNQKQNQATFE